MNKEINLGLRVSVKLQKFEGSAESGQLVSEELFEKLVPVVTLGENDESNDKRD